MSGWTDCNNNSMVSCRSQTLGQANAITAARDHINHNVWDRQLSQRCSIILIFISGRWSEQYLRSEAWCWSPSWIKAIVTKMKSRNATVTKVRSCTSIITKVICDKATVTQVRCHKSPHLGELHLSPRKIACAACRPWPLREINTSYIAIYPNDEWLIPCHLLGGMSFLHTLTSSGSLMAAFCSSNLYTQVPSASNSRPNLVRRESHV